jgi:ketosteroid isomerase-like protein
LNLSSLINWITSHEKITVMTPQEQLIHTFYSSFQTRDYRTMQECYADHATFSDPVFQNLNASQVRAMWEMFLVKNESLTMKYSGVEYNGETVTANWTADYVLSTTGNSVTNSIRSEFRIEEGKIVQHTDRFDFYRWSRQALGFKGILFGWTPFVKNAVRRSAMASLQNYIRNWA